MPHTHTHWKNLLVICIQLRLQWGGDLQQIVETEREEKRVSHYPTYQNASAILVIVDSGQMQRGPAMLAALLNVNAFPIFAHHL